MRLQRRELELIPFLEHLRADLEPRMTSGVDFEIQVADDVPRHLETDQGRLRQVLLNLLSNAIKFTARGAVRLRIERCPDDACLRFTVQDEGIGMNAEELEHIFEEFRQVTHSSPIEYGGTGLGLTICKSLVEVMGGEIGAASLPGEGTTVWFTTPLALALTEDVQLVRTKDIRQPKPAQFNGRALVVDDNRVNRLVASRFLKRHGCAVEVAKHGQEALELLTAERFDIVFMDCQMPVLDGYATTAQIRNGGHRYSQMPVIAMTAAALPGDRDRCLAAGMNDHLTKPIDTGQLAAVLGQWLRPRT